MNYDFIGQTCETLGMLQISGALYKKFLRFCSSMKWPWDVHNWSHNTQRYIHVWIFSQNGEWPKSPYMYAVLARAKSLYWHSFLLIFISLFYSISESDDAVVIELPSHKRSSTSRHFSIHAFGNVYNLNLEKAEGVVGETLPVIVFENGEDYEDWTHKVCIFGMKTGMIAPIQIAQQDEMHVYGKTVCCVSALHALAMCLPKCCHFVYIYLYTCIT